uniref:Uncharacterized protein n=1 Tax=Palpitomonas bilix TaxID=652834 RepID=A0A7S3DBQ2_9EUKA|mmetsp:Transcript_29986/g.77375  ORF Transcript_29986/g.77375 Transcript_29986/m.77375 type:complete len:520 (+) Transcript_29986:225-1784(+)
MDVVCEHCGRSVPAVNYVMHEINCKKHSAECGKCGAKMRKDEADKHLADALDFHRTLNSATTGYKGQVQAYIVHGGDINKKGPGGTTLLHAAVHGGNEEICSLLLENGARRDVVNSLFDTPFQLAMKRQKGKKLSVQMILSLQTGDEESCSTKSSQRGGRGGQLKDVQTAKTLRRSASLGSLLEMFPSLKSSDSAEVEVNEGASPPSSPSGAHRGHSSDVSDLTPEKTRSCPHCQKAIPKDNFELHVNFCSRHFETCMWCSQSVKKDEMEEHAAKYSSEGLLKLAAEGDMDGVYNAILHGADVNTTSSAGDTPLHMAMRSGAKQVVHLLLKSGADKTKRNVMHSSPLDVATLSMKESFLEEFSEDAGGGQTTLAPPRPTTARTSRREEEERRVHVDTIKPPRHRRAEASEEEEGYGGAEASPEALFAGGGRGQEERDRYFEGGYVFESSSVLNASPASSPASRPHPSFDSVEGEGGSGNNSPSLLSNGFVPGTGGFPIAPRPPKAPQAKGKPQRPRSRK